MPISATHNDDAIAEPSQQSQPEGRTLRSKTKATIDAKDAGPEPTKLSSSGKKKSGSGTGKKGGKKGKSKGGQKGSTSGSKKKPVSKKNPKKPADKLDALQKTIAETVRHSCIYLYCVITIVYRVCAWTVNMIKRVKKPSTRLSLRRSAKPQPQHPKSWKQQYAPGTHLARVLTFPRLRLYSVPQSNVFVHIHFAPFVCLLTSPFSQAKIEIELLDALYERMLDPELGTISKTADESQILPLHLHPEAANPELPHENLSHISTIFRTTYEDLQQMSPEVIRKIFSRRHILVTDIPVHPKWAWNEFAAADLGPIDIPISVQGNLLCSLRGVVF